VLRKRLSPSPRTLVSIYDFVFSTWSLIAFTAAQTLLRAAREVEDFTELPQPSQDALRQACAEVERDWRAQGKLPKVGRSGEHHRVQSQSGV